MSQQPTATDYIADNEPLCVNCDDEGCHYCDDDGPSDLDMSGWGDDEFDDDDVCYPSC